MAPKRLLVSAVKAECISVVILIMTSVKALQIGKCSGREIVKQNATSGEYFKLEEK